MLSLLAGSKLNLGGVDSHVEEAQALAPLVDDMSSMNCIDDTWPIPAPIHNTRQKLLV